MVLVFKEAKVDVHNGREWGIAHPSETADVPYSQVFLDRRRYRKVCVEYDASGLLWVCTSELDDTLVFPGYKRGEKVYFDSESVAPMEEWQDERPSADWCNGTAADAADCYYEGDSGGRIYICSVTTKLRELAVKRLATVESRLVTDEIVQLLSNNPQIWLEYEVHRLGLIARIDPDPANDRIWFSPASR